MILEDGCNALKLECALRDLGFVEIGWKVIALSGIFFISPVGWGNDTTPEDELLGFLLQKHIMAESHIEKNNPKLLVKSAKEALNLAETITNASINDW